MGAPDYSKSDIQGKILAVGDIHLGTRCAGLPEKLREWGVNKRKKKYCAFSITASCLPTGAFCVSARFGALSPTAPHGA